MKIRYKISGCIDNSSTFNINAMAEVLTHEDSISIKDLDIQLQNGEWKDMAQAFKDHDIITDNYNTSFFFPTNEEDKKRGYTL